MARYLQSNIIKAAVGRLGESRASKSMLHFLVFKRAIASGGNPVVSFSVNNPNLGGAVDDLTKCAMNGSPLPAALRETPHINVFGSGHSAWQYLGANWRSNGTGPALSGAVWRGIVDVVSERPRNGKLSQGYESKLSGILLKAGSQLPVLTDAAIWYHRADDLEARFGSVADSAQLDERLRESFIEQLGLTDEEVAALFNTEARPLGNQPLGDVLRDTVADPQEYLPDLGGGSGELGEMLGEFETLATSATVGLRVGRPLMLRLAAALGAKRFLILGGLAGSGKTKLAQAFARWLTPAVEEGQPGAYAVIPVGADWTGNDNILGYPDGLDPKRYVTRPALISSSAPRCRTTRKYRTFLSSTR